MGLWDVVEVFAVDLSSYVDTQPFGCFFARVAMKMHCLQVHLGSTASD